MKSTDIIVTPTGVRFMGRKFPCTIGRGGLTDSKTEGDMATPRGPHRIVGMLYRPDRIAQPADWAVPIKLGDLWSDDVADDNYNKMVRVPHSYSHEDLRRADPMYDLVIITDWNWPNAVKGRGSAIFIHQWQGKGRPTAGCVAFVATIYVGLADKYALKPDLLSHNHWTLTHIPVQTDKEFEA